MGLDQTLLNSSEVRLVPGDCRLLRGSERADLSLFSHPSRERSKRPPIWSEEWSCPSACPAKQGLAPDAERLWEPDQEFPGSASVQRCCKGKPLQISHCLHSREPRLPTRLSFLLVETYRFSFRGC